MKISTAYLVSVSKYMGFEPFEVSVVVVTQGKPRK